MTTNEGFAVTSIAYEFSLGRPILIRFSFLFSVDSVVVASDPNHRQAPQTRTTDNTEDTEYEEERISEEPAVDSLAGNPN